MIIKERVIYFNFSRNENFREARYFKAKEMLTPEEPVSHQKWHPPLVSQKDHFKLVFNDRPDS